MTVSSRWRGAAVPTVETELRAGDAAAGHVTSAAYSPRLSAAVALGYVRRGSHEPGTRLFSTIGEAEVVPLPMV